MSFLNRTYAGLVGPDTFSGTEGWEPADLIGSVPRWAEGVDQAFFGRDPDIFKRRYVAHILCRLIRSDPTLYWKAMEQSDKQPAIQSPAPVFAKGWDTSSIQVVSGSFSGRLVQPEKPISPDRLVLFGRVTANGSTLTVTSGDLAVVGTPSPLVWNLPQTGQKLVLDASPSSATVELQVKTRPALMWKNIEEKLNRLANEDRTRMFRHDERLAHLSKDPLEVTVRLAAWALALSQSRGEG